MTEKAQRTAYRGTSNQKPVADRGHGELTVVRNGRASGWPNG
jgi:hypothetical protein